MHRSTLSLMARGLLAVALRCAIPLGIFALSGCDAFFGSKGDETTDEILDEGRTDPTLPNDVGYVPLNPFFQTGGDGAALDAPTDVYVGYDELVYVGDARGLHVLDLAGRPQAFLGDVGGQALRGIQAVVQDRRLEVYVAARRDTTLDGRTWNLPVVYRLSGLTTGQPRLADIIWHPFDDNSRRANQFRTPRAFSGGSDEDAVFTGVAVLADNRVYITRRGPVNTAGAGLPNIVAPFNAVLEFTAEGENTRLVNALSPTQPSLLSAVFPSDITTLIGPPQRATLPATADFFIAQSPEAGGLRYGVLSVRVVETVNGTEYRVDTERLAAAANPAGGDGFLYESFQFKRPSGLAYAPDGTNYLFVVDAGKDSLFVFNRTGVEGVAPPPGANSLRPVGVSFGGSGAGALQFNAPEGVAYFERTVYVADTGNDRIARFRLNTDFE